MPKPMPERTAEENAAFDHDLHPHTAAAQPNRTAHEVKSVNRDLAGSFTDDELKAIPILPEGATLDAQATYLDLNNLSRGELSGYGGRKSGPNEMLVPKDGVDYAVYNRLRGITDPERTQSVAEEAVTADDGSVETMEEHDARMRETDGLLDADA